MSPRTMRIAVALSVALGGCAEQAFTPQFPESQDPEITLSLRALGAPEPGDEPPVIVGGRGDGLFAFDPVAGQLLWRADAQLTSAPLAAGAFVIATEGAQIVGRRLTDGEVRFRLEPGQRLVGAHGDGSRVVITAAVGPELSPRGVVTFVADGDVRWTEELDLPVGRAALVGNRVLVPWATQRVSILEAASGRELARFRMTDSVVGHAMRVEDSVYIGQHGLLRVQEGIEQGNREAAPYYEPMGRPLPGQPPLLRDGYEPLPGPEAAPHRVRLAWRPTRDGDRIGLANGTLYYVFYRLVFALDASEDSVRWVRVLPADVVGVEVRRDGTPVLVDARGEVVALAPETGLPRWRMSIGTAATAADVRLGDGEPRGTPAPEAEPVPLVEQLIAAVTVEDPRLAGGRALAARYLGRHEGAEVTGRLVTLCAERSLPESIRLAACEQVATRDEGLEHVRRALAAKGSFLEGTTAPPVGPLARAAAHMGARGLAGVLVRHLADPATPNEELPALLEALATLESEAAAEPIERFFVLHHAEHDDAALTQAVIAAAGALRELRGDRASPVLRTAMADALTSPPVRAGIEAVLGRPTPAERAAAEVAAQREAEAQAAAPEDTRPARIDARMTGRVFEPVTERLQGCIPEGQSSLRVAMAVSETGVIEHVVVSPATAQECAEPIVRERAFPATRGGRQQVNHTVRRPSEPEPSGDRAGSPG